MKILLVRLSSMGDLIHTLPALSDLRQYRPDIELDWLTEAAFADIARLHPSVRVVKTLRWRQWRKTPFQAAVRRELATLRRDLQAERYDWVLDAQGLLKSAAFARFAGAPVYGLDGSSAREPLAALFYARRFAVEKGRDAVWRNRQLLAQAFGYTPDDAADFGVVLPETAAVADLSSDYAVALHASSRDSKLWPQNHWRDCLKRLHEHYGWTIYLPWGSETERTRAEQLAQDLPFVRVCPRMDLLQAAALLRGAQAVLGVDTGLLHLADAVGAPLVGIYTDSDPAKTGVQPSPRAVSLGGIGQIPSVDEVMQALAISFQAA